MKTASRLLAPARARLAGAGEAAWVATAVGLLVAQRVAISVLDRGGMEAELRRALFFVTTAALIGLALHFRRLAGAWLIAVGIALNFAPMAAHGGLMPVAIETVEASGAFPEISEADIGHQIANSKDVVLERDGIRLYALSDRFYVEAPLYGGNIYSAGDFVIFGGIALAAGQVVAMIAAGGAHAFRRQVVSG